MTVLDLTRLLPGGLCTQLLADLGANVIKVEEPGRGDYMRTMNPPVYAATNRNKRSLTLDLKTAAGKELLLQLARWADVLVESSRPGVMARLGLDYRVVQGVNPRLVYCSLTGFGQDGPYRDRSGHDINYLALAGILHQSGYPDRPPVVPPIPVVDLGPGGYTAAFAILAALRRSERTGAGTYLDISLYDGTVTWNTPLLRYLATGHADRRGGSPFDGGYPCYRAYATADGEFIALGALEPKFWQAFCTAAGRLDLVERQFDAGGDMTAEMESLFAARTRAEWCALLAEVDACWAPVLHPDEVAGDPHVQARALLVDGQFRLPFRMEPEEPLPRRPAPVLGEHTEAILDELGVDAQRCAELRRSGVI